MDYPGRSAIHDCFGVALAEGGSEEGLVIADVDIGQIRTWRARFPALSDRRPEVYPDL